jgi:hypothetical protein
MTLLRRDIGPVQRRQHKDRDMKTRSFRQSGWERATVSLGVELEKCIVAYAAAAVAAGVSSLALAGSAHARVIYTSAHEVVPRGRAGLPLDLNHDGIVDFSFKQSYFSSGSGVGVSPKQDTNEVWGRGGSTSTFNRFASAILPGQKLGANATYFGRGHAFLARWGAVLTSGSFTQGQWLYAKYRYLGLKFVIGQKVHYGWARLNIDRGTVYLIKATLTGYAYETIPNKPIIAGKTHGPDVIVKHATLGKLALGRR